MSIRLFDGALCRTRDGHEVTVSRRPGLYHVDTYSYEYRHPEHGVCHVMNTGHYYESKDVCYYDLIEVIGGAAVAPVREVDWTIGQRVWAEFVVDTYVSGTVMAVTDDGLFAVELDPDQVGRFTGGMPWNCAGHVPSGRGWFFSKSQLKPYTAVKLESDEVPPCPPPAPDDRLPCTDVDILWRLWVESKDRQYKHDDTAFDMYELITARKMLRAACKPGM